MMDMSEWFLIGLGVLICLTTVFYVLRAEHCVHCHTHQPPPTGGGKFDTHDHPLTGRVDAGNVVDLASFKLARQGDGRYPLRRSA